MTPEQIRLVQQSFKLVPADAAAEIFYTRLFEISPNLRKLFPQDLRAQGRKLMTMIGLAVAGLDHIDRLLPAVRDLGARHAGYGVLPHHYEIVAAALLWTLERGLGEYFTAEVRQAWVEAYGMLSSTMIEAAQQKAA